MARKPKVGRPRAQHGQLRDRKVTIFFSEDELAHVREAIALIHGGPTPVWGRQQLLTMADRIKETQAKLAQNPNLGRRADDRNP